MPTYLDSHMKIDGGSILERALEVFHNQTDFIAVAPDVEHIVSLPFNGTGCGHL